MSAMIIYHKHHIIPRHIGGTDEPSNLIKLTVEEHAEAHRVLYENHGRWQDYVAWQTLCGQITHKEAIKLSQSLANIGDKNPMFGMFGEKNPNYVNRGKKSPLYGKKQPKEWNIKKRKALIGRSLEDLHGKEKAEEIRNKFKKPKTEAHKKNLSKPKPKTVCRLFDRKEMCLGNFMNWYKNNG
jgi:hypothetical protein